MGQQLLVPSKIAVSGLIQGVSGRELPPEQIYFYFLF
ncbi:hypothetical protein BN997_02448 [Oceanobacillus oncorhynchi]|uniref:Uncharacterized protein n=1 Tax=Oceanobacillus oncorhynchi TaxID=545501 RepID=A0A0A1MUH0_9BACI|nr:hypothetical protein BN997_02448 [Oceanobacillus oncorhynchi]